MEKPMVSIVMGSDSDLAVMQGAISNLEKFGIGYTVDFASAHRVPDAAAKLAQDAQRKGIKVIIAGAGGAAHLPGVLAAHTTLPVIGVPLKSRISLLDGLDAVLSILQMPPGIPVATVGTDRADNAGILAAQIIGLSEKNVAEKLAAYKKEMAKSVESKNARLQEIGYKKYLSEK